MKKNLGSVLALYPTPLVVVGSMVEDKPNWVLVGHVGILGHDHVLVSLAKTHYSNQGIRKNKTLSINIINKELLPKADYVGCISGAKSDKSKVFDYSMGESGVPMISDSPVVMECEVEDIYETQGFDNFICIIQNTFADEKVLDEKGKIDYHILKPILFEMPTYEYLETGDVLGKCMTMHKMKEE